MTDWNPQDYLIFADERARPAADLAARVPLARPRVVYDLGCGPGNSTALLAQQFPEAKVVGIDKSPAMIAKAKELGLKAEFQVADIAFWKVDRAADLVFSNAALQWLPDHPRLMQRIVRDLKAGAVLAVQMPDNLNEPTHVSMREVADDGRWRGKLSNATKQRAPILAVHEYHELLRHGATSVDIWKTTYFHRVKGAAGIAAFFSSTGLRPFLDPLSAVEQESFLTEYVGRVAQHYPAAADGTVLFGMPRLFILVRK